MAHLYVFRHGQSEFNLRKVFTGWMDSRLTPEGIRQARDLGRMLKDVRIDLAIQTRLSRAQDTLREVLAFHPECKTVLTDDRMIERSYGDLAGQTHQGVVEQYGKEQFEKWHRGYATPPPGGESFADVAVRVGEFLDDLRGRYGGQDINIAISAHGNSIRVLRKILENASEAECVSWTIPYDRYFEYTL